MATINMGMEKRSRFDLSRDLVKAKIITQTMTLKLSLHVYKYCFFFYVLLSMRLRPHEIGIVDSGALTWCVCWVYALVNSCNWQKWLSGSAVFHSFRFTIGQQIGENEFTRAACSNAIAYLFDYTTLYLLVSVFWLAHISSPLQINTQCVFSLIKVRYLHHFAPSQICCVRLFFYWVAKSRPIALNCVPTQPAFFASSFYSICSENMPEWRTKKKQKSTEIEAQQPKCVCRSVQYRVIEVPSTHRTII